MFHNLAKGVEVRPLTIEGTNYLLTAGTSDVDSGSVDTDGYDGVMFIVLPGIISASGAISVKAAQSSDDGSTDGYSDIAGTLQGPTADTDDNKAIVIDIYRPKKRYVRVHTTRGDGGNSVINALVALLYHAGNEPVVQGSTVFGCEVFNSPAEGTA